MLHPKSVALYSPAYWATPGLPSLAGDCGLPMADAMKAAGRPHGTQRAVVLAVGPEGGWVDYEVQMFKEHGFTQVALRSSRAFCWWRWGI